MRAQAILSGHRVAIDPHELQGADWLTGRPVWIGGQSAGSVQAVDDLVLRLQTLPEGARPGDVVEIDSGWEAPVLGMKLLLHQRGGPPPGSLAFRLGTTKGTNALLEQKGAPTALFLSRGFQDLLRIRDQKRPELFARQISRPDPLYRCVHGLTGRMTTAGTEEEPLDQAEIGNLGRRALEAGCEVAAVCLLNSWANPRHEVEVGQLLTEVGFRVVCLSAAIRPLIHYLNRSETVLIEATLSPVMESYLDRVQAEIGEDPLWVMSSAGGLVSRARFRAVDSLVSGPAGGMLGAVSAGRRAGMERIIALDMGGTSTDVSRWKRRIDLRQHVQVGEARILTPAMPIETVAAGGGSICSVDGERLQVGPRSAGADPGPAAYGAGGPLTLTDIHLLLGRIDPAGFAIPIRLEAAQKAMEAVAEQALAPDWKELAEGFLSIATERMAHAIRQVSLREGEDPADYGLVAFGGAGGLHACRVAEALGMSRVLFPSDAGLLSARGIHYAPREAVLERQYIAPLEETRQVLPLHLAALTKEAVRQLTADGVAPGALEEPEETVFLRLAGQESSLPLRFQPGADLAAAFRERFVAVFGYFPKDPRLEAVKLRVRLLEKGEAPDAEHFPDSLLPGQASAYREGFAGGRDRRIPVIEREQLEPGQQVRGPAIIRDPFGTGFIEEGWTGTGGTAGSVLVERDSGMAVTGVATRLEKVQKTLVLNRLEALVEEMGEQLRQTALSTNIRERLDFSCALLDAEGRLLVNAPHIPVHLGAMGLCVRECLKSHVFGPGDVLITNHPGAGGSHLPDVTLISGLFDGNGALLGYLANRAHHAEWGGKTPGSMPPDAACLEEEGVILHPQWLIRGGEDRFAEIVTLLREAPYPSRAVRENRIDLEAQLAALRRGMDLFDSLLSDHDATLLLRYFGELYRMGAEALAGVLATGGCLAGSACEELDDGHRIQVAIRPEADRLLIDFAGTSPRHPGNLNATPAIVRSTVLYVLRLLVDIPMPLNEGLLDRVEIRLPACFLNPGFPEDPRRCPAVVGGNVETSQRLAEALIRALGLMAASQGTMNNFLFGNERFGHYETIGGGAGAGPHFDGASGVHVHMTNTAITDPEILEQRFPASCREFSIRKGSGGRGRHAGGDGLVREWRFHEPVTVSLLTQNRVRGARGAAGGGDGQRGAQWRILRDGTRHVLPGCIRLSLQAGESIRMETPGGGAWGHPSQDH